MTETPPDSPKPVTGRTWADLFAGFPIWLIAIAAAVFVLLMAYATLLANRQVELGFLGRWGPPAPGGAGGGIPAGAVVAFDFDLKSEAGCPDGWDFFEPGGGRVIVGAGDHDNRWFPAGSDEAQRISIYKTYAQDARAGVQETREAEATGGEERVALTVEEMPAHDHGGRTDARSARLLVNDFGNHSAGVRGLASETGRAINVDFIDAHDHTLAAAGGGPDGTARPHNNMPPFIALYFCRKS